MVNSQMTSQIDQLSRKDLESLLMDMKMYQDMTKVSKKKAGTLFAEQKSGKSAMKIEHFGSLDSTTKDMLVSLYNSSFNSVANTTSIDWRQNDDLEGGVRMFFADDLIDISLSDFEKMILK